jgi:hypothetical protein
MLMHASNNTAAFVWGRFTADDQVLLWWVWAALWVTTMAAIVIATGVNLAGRKPRTS